MKILNRFIIIALLTVASSLFAGTKEGGGGGAYKVNGELKTLAEAGVIFEKISKLGSKAYPKYYYISEETKRAVSEITEKLPYSVRATFYDSNVLGRRDTFIDQTNIDISNYNLIKKDYEKVIRSYGKRLDESAFILTAYSENFKTYILPSFEDLKPYQQALILIHEYFMRHSLLKGTERLAYILNMDVIIYNILQNGYDEALSLRYFESLEKLGQVSSSDINVMRIARLENLIGRPLLFSDLTINGDTNAIDPSLVQNFEKYLPGIADDLNGYGLAVGSSAGHLSLSRTLHELAQKANRFMERLIGFASSPRKEIENANKPKFDSICGKFDVILKQSELYGDSFISLGYREQLYSFRCRLNSQLGRQEATDQFAVELGELK